MTSPIFHLHFGLLFLFIFFTKLSNCIESNTIDFCPEIEKHSLLTFKQSLRDCPQNSLISSWNNGEANCCKWEGVVCEDSTGHVSELRLIYSNCMGGLNESLLNLEHLTRLDLTGNSFLGETIPSFIGSFSNLEYLDLSYSGFGGKIPPHIGNLSNLRHLDLSSQPGSPYHLETENLEWLARLSKLEKLNLGGSNLSRANNWGEAINSLPSLFDLSLNGCDIDYFQHRVNNLSTSLMLISFSCDDRIRGIYDESCLDKSFPIPYWLFQISSLVSLDLRFNSFSGQIPAITNATKLQLLDFSFNDLNSTIPDSVYSCKDLKSLDLTYNSIQGQISEAIGNLSSLEHLKLSNNKLTGNLPVSLGQLSNLILFRVENNQLEGIVNEAHFANISNLDRFFASGNHLTLSVGPNWILPKNISMLGLRSWRLGAGPHTPSWLLHVNKNIKYLDISDAGILGTIPSWFFDVWFLNVSFNNFHGNIPPYINSNVTHMSRNNFSGSLPRIGAWVSTLDLSYNKFSDGLSNIFCNSTYQTYALNSLVLEGNLLSGELPDCWDGEKWSRLQILNVGNNTMSGRLPDSFGSLWSLTSLNLYANKFTGQIPFSMRNCTGLLKMDLGYNNLDGKVSTWIGTSLTKLEVLILHSNKFVGEIPRELCHLQSLQILDLSNNEISGLMPKCLHNLTAMATKRQLPHVARDNGIYIMLLNPFMETATITTKGLELEYTTILPLVTNIDLSNNNLSGEIPKDLTRLVMLGSLNLSRNQLSSSIPESIGEMKQLESIDFSRNNLSGQIPNGFTRLFSLSFLNLSFNNLSGRIPQSTQLQTMDASMYMGNDLCGPPLARNCSSDEGEEAHGHNGGETEEGKKKGEVEWMYVLLSLGYAVGFSGVCSVLVLKRSWRVAYFGFVEKIWDKLYVYFHLWIHRS